MKSKTPPCHVTINLKSWLTDPKYNNNRVWAIMLIILHLNRNAKYYDEAEWNLWQARKHQPNFSTK